MNPGLKWKLIVGFVLVFAAGVMTGAFVTASQAHRLFGPHHGVIAERMRNHLRSQLRLTDEQMAKISPVIDRTATQLENIRAETARRVHDTFAESHREIATDLTPDQRAKLQAIEERHRRFFQHRGRPHSILPSAESPAPP